MSETLPQEQPEEKFVTRERYMKSKEKRDYDKEMLAFIMQREDREDGRITEQEAL